MPFRSSHLLWLAAALVAACSPALNWREVQGGDGRIRALLPCKPDHATRSVVMGAQSINITMQGCEAAGALFAVAVADIPSSLNPTAVQAQWEQYLLTTMRAETVRREPASPADASPRGPQMRLLARGQGPDNGLLQVEAVWYARGQRLYHAAVYAQRIDAEMREPFFASLELK